MTTQAQLSAVGRVLSRVLRHEPGLIGIRLDAAGWISVDDLVTAIERARSRRDAPSRIRELPAVSPQVIAAVVAADVKARFTLSGTGPGARIRAAQGHSIAVDLGYPESTPPPVLYHGTSRDRLASIARDGLLPMQRHAVHLSSDAKTARRVGSRHGTAVVLIVDAATMHSDGAVFFLADNLVWLVSAVPVRYLSGQGLGDQKLSGR